MGAEKSKGNSFLCPHISASSASSAVNTSAPFIRRPVGTALLTVAVALAWIAGLSTCENSSEPRQERHVYSKSSPRSAPVLGRSEHRLFRCVRFHWGSLAFRHCCARGRAHSAETIPRRR